MHRKFSSGFFDLIRENQRIIHRKRRQITADLDFLFAGKTGKITED